LRFPVGDLRHLDFSPPDVEKFPCLRLAYEAAQAGGAKTVALNAADEVAVAGFLDGDIRFSEIARSIEEVLGRTPEQHPATIAEVLAADAEARRLAAERIQSLVGKKSGSLRPALASHK
ncbi:MAG TPA: 1-deoxy-D-xylulose-5-phosphate reductoisomerase, partial [Terriglobales bacterium]|nr:1-deoxy-D-xylulose-5-phosphate reductoisomerase [Terriglobales bacterium]